MIRLFKILSMVVLVTSCSKQPIEKLNPALLDEVNSHVKLIKQNIINPKKMLLGIVCEQFNDTTKVSVNFIYDKMLLKETILKNYKISYMASSDSVMIAVFETFQPVIKPDFDEKLVFSYIDESDRSYDNYHPIRLIFIHNQLISKDYPSLEFNPFSRLFSKTHPLPVN